MRQLLIIVFSAVFLFILTIPAHAAVITSQSQQSINQNTNIAAGGNANAYSGGLPYTGSSPIPYQTSTPVPATMLNPAPSSYAIPTATPQVMGYTPTTTKKLPETGPSIWGLGLASLFPIGWKLKNLGNIKTNSSDFIDLWNDRFFKKLS